MGYIAISVKLRLQLPTGTELGNNNFHYLMETGKEKDKIKSL